jgi:hypothetical protein
MIVPTEEIQKEVEIPAPNHYGEAFDMIMEEKILDKDQAVLGVRSLMAFHQGINSRISTVFQEAVDYISEVEIIRFLKNAK